MMVQVPRIHLRHYAEWVGGLGNIPLGLIARCKAGCARWTTARADHPGAIRLTLPFSWLQLKHECPGTDEHDMRADGEFSHFVEHPLNGLVKVRRRNV